MPPEESTAAESFAAALGRYAEPALRGVAGRWFRPRTQWDAEELRERIAKCAGDAVAVDRVLKTVSPAARQLLRLMGFGAGTRWRVRQLADFAVALGHPDGAALARELLDAGLLFPAAEGRPTAIADLSAWIVQAAQHQLPVLALPLAAARCRGEAMPLPELPSSPLGGAAAQTADGLEWLLRLAVVWQTLQSAPMRRAQHGGLFKRDFDRLRSHPLLNAAPAEQLHPLPDPELLALALAGAAGVAIFDEDQIRVGSLPAEWAAPLGTALLALLAAWLNAEGWDPVRGGLTSDDPPAPGAVLGVLVLAALATAPRDNWVRAADVDAALMAVPDLNPGAGSAFALGVAHQFRLTEAAKHGGEWWVRLTPLGCAAANGSEPPDLRPEFEQTLLVQPNLEVVLYRQGLTPHLLARLTRIAEWRTLGLACTLGLTAESVYRGLESGETLAEVVALLERHGTRAVSETVLGSLRSWASKRERVLVYPAALLLEFVSAAELDRALREGLVEHKVADRIGLIGSEQRIDYGRFRLTGTRDYLAPDERCVELNGDGLTFAVNAHKSDLLLESEARRFAELLPMSGTDDRWRFRMTPETLATARLGGMDVAALNQWFLRRAGGPLSPTAKMLLAGRELPPVRLEQLVVLRAPTAELADGIAAWAETRGYVRERLAPTLLAVPADAVAALQARLAEIGVQFETEAQ